MFLIVTLRWGYLFSVCDIVTPTHQFRLSPFQSLDWHPSVLRDHPLIKWATIRTPIIAIPLVPLAYNSPFLRILKHGRCARYLWCRPLGRFPCCSVGCSFTCSYLSSIPIRYQVFRHPNNSSICLHEALPRGCNTDQISSKILSSIYVLRLTNPRSLQYGLCLAL